MRRQSVESEPHWSSWPAMVTGGSTSPSAMPRTVFGVLFILRIPSNLVAQNLPYAAMMAHDEVFRK
jgi:hypothetical protein